MKLMPRMHPPLGRKTLREAGKHKTLYWSQHFINRKQFWKKWICFSKIIDFKIFRTVFSFSQPYIIENAKTFANFNISQVSMQNILFFYKNL